MLTCLWGKRGVSYWVLAQKSKTRIKGLRIWTKIVFPYIIWAIVSHFLAPIFNFLNPIRYFKERKWTNMSLSIYYTHQWPNNLFLTTSNDHWRQQQPTHWWQLVASTLMKVMFSWSFYFFNITCIVSLCFLFLIGDQST